MKEIKKSNYILKSVVLFLFFGASLIAQKKEVLLNPAIKSGTLQNGMKYFIMHNEEPKQRASFYFAQNVGSVLENESQRGLAHFLEHMAFNGTEHFKGKEMLNYLQKNGVRFGSEINAFTSWDKTVYNISKVPTTNEKLLDSVLLILHDWSGSLSLEDKEIDAERGVVNEEWRTRDNPKDRANEKVFTDGLVKGSIYQNRMPIGLMSVVNNFKYDELRDYYKKWYRPDQQAVIIVGDIDVVQMEQKVIALFSKIPLIKGLPIRPKFEVPLTNDFTYIQSLDKELGDATLYYYIKDKVVDLKGTDAIDNSIVTGLVSKVFNGRLSDFTADESCPALSIKYVFENQVRSLDALSLTIRPKSNKMEEAFKFSLTELARFVKYGATAGELQRAKLETKNLFIAGLKNLDKVSSDAYAKKLYGHFLEDEPFPDYTWYYNYIIKKLDQITNEDIIAFLKSKYKYDDVMFGIAGTDEGTYPNKGAIQKIITEVKNQNLEKYKDNFIDKPLVSGKLKGSKVKSSFTIPGSQAKGYELSNGAKVIIYPTNYDTDRIFFQAFSKGGGSLVPDALLDSKNLAIYVASESGEGDFDKMALKKKLAGTNTSVYKILDETQEKITGRSTKTDIEVLLQRIYLSFEAPRFDKKAFDYIITNSEKNIKNSEKNVKSAFMDSLNLAFSNHSKRTILFNEKSLKKIKLKDIEKIYKSRFSNASDFTFVFVGDIDEKQFLTLVEKYIGSISSKGTTENFVDHNLDAAKGKTEVHLTKQMTTPQATVSITFEGLTEYNVKNKLVFDMIGQLLNSRYLDVIREQEGGSYGVSCGGWLISEPKEKALLRVDFDCNPDKTDKLVSEVYNEVNKLATVVNSDNLVEAKKSLIKKRKESNEQNLFWLGEIVNQQSAGTKILSLDEYINLINSIDENDIKKMVKEVVQKSNIVEGILKPKK